MDCKWIADSLSDKAVVQEDVRRCAACPDRHPECIVIVGVGDRPCRVCEEPSTPVAVVAVEVRHPSAADELVFADALHGRGWAALSVSAIHTNVRSFPVKDLASSSYHWSRCRLCSFVNLDCM